MRRCRSVKLNILMYITAALLCATLFSIHLVSGLYARYYTRSSGTAHARVARFKITGSGTVFTETIETDATPGTTDTEYTIIIENDSEIKVEYTLTVTNTTGNLPLTFELNPKEVSGTTAPAATTTKNEKGVSISKAVQEAGNHTDEYTLNIIWDNSDPEANLALMGMVDYITISVTVTQVD